MNIYKVLNEIIEYIDENLENNIDYNELSKMMGTNEYAIKRIFPLITNISISEYIRNRRLSNAGFDLYKKDEKIIDIAIKYGYDNATSFSRAFEKFHGIKPSYVKTNPEKLKTFPKLHFNEDIVDNHSMEYSIIEMDEIVLYGKGIKTIDSTISKDAPSFFKKMERKYSKKYGEIPYGMIKYEARFCSDNYEYWIAYDKKIDEFEEIIIPKSKWLLFRINSQEPVDIRNVSQNFYKKFVPSSKYKIKPLPELEHYYNGITDFLVAIEN